MAARTSLDGVLLPVITPLSDDGSLDGGALEGLCHHYLDAGLTGIVALGTTGEFATLEPDERRRVVEICAGACRQRGAPLLVGPGSNDTATTIASLRALAEVDGVTAALCLVPYFLRPGEAGAVAHFEALAASSPLPIVVYNFPARTAQPLGTDALLRLAKTPGIVGVKQSLPLDADGLRLLAEAPGGFAVHCGDDAFLFPATLLGASGGISALAHVCTSRVLAMVEAGSAGKVEDGRAHHEALLPVNAALLAEAPPTLFKGVLHAQGRIRSPRVRLPLLPASPAAVDAALAAIDAAGGGGAEPSRRRSAT